KKLRLILLTHGGSETALERLLALDCARVARIFIETDTMRRVSFREKLKRSIRYDGYRATVAKFFRKLRSPRALPGASATESSHELIRRIAEAHQVPIHFLSNYHSEDSIALRRSANADLGVILGTNILKQS